MAIAIISDIHGNLAALDAVLADIERRGIEEVYCLGDVAFKGPQPAECVDRLREAEIPCVYGNTDRWLTDDPPPAQVGSEVERAAREWGRRQLGPERLEWLAGLPFGHIVELEGLTALLVHGSPRSENEFTYPDLKKEELAPLLEGVTEDVVCVGHHHLPMVRRALGKWIVGPGSVGLPRGDNRAGYAVLETGAGGSLAVSLVQVPYDPAAAIRAGEERQMPGLEGFREWVTAGQSE